MNTHHLELFYYVALHGGISAGARKMPYGIQQPAVSGQLLQLERELGLQLFQRRPFVLTPAGRELFAFVEPFFGQIRQMPQRLRSEEDARLRLAAPATILRDHLPALLRDHKRKYPSVTLQLHDANHATAEELLHKRKIDLAITELEGRPAPGLNSAILLKLPLMLVVPESSKIGGAAELWRRGTPAETLISLPSHEVITKQFDLRLREIGVSWPTGVEVSSLDLIPIYVSLGFGVGLSVAVPGVTLPSGVRTFPLAKFPPLVIGALWRDDLRRANAEFLDQITRLARTIAGQARGQPAPVSARRKQRSRL